MPSKAGIQRLQSHVAMKPWIPAFAGMTFLQVARATAVSRVPERIETHKLANEPAIPL